MTDSCVTVFGGTGFLGRRIVARLIEDGHRVRVAVRHPERVEPQQANSRGPEPVRADVRDAASVERAAAGAWAVINAVSLYTEHGNATFQSVHVDGAATVAGAAERAGAERLVHISGIGADSASNSAYIRARGEGEKVVRAAFGRAIILRPSVMFGPDDAFLRTLTELVNRLPVIPLFGRGQTRLQPVFVGDVAEAAVRALVAPAAAGLTYELGGAEVLTYRDILGRIMKKTAHKRLRLPVPFFIWDLLAAAARFLPQPPLTEGQVALMKRDNVPAVDMPGFDDLDIAPITMDEFLDDHVKS